MHAEMANAVVTIFFMACSFLETDRTRSGASSLP
jgi:hypothetical protein